MAGHSKKEQIRGARAIRHEDDGYFYLTIELHAGFAIQASLCRETGEVRCELWDERNSVTQDYRPDAGLYMTPYEFLEWREVACGREPRDYFGAHWRATHKAEIDSELAKPAKTRKQIKAEWRAIRRAEAAKTPEQKTEDWEKQKAIHAAAAAERKKEIEEQVRALQADTGFA